MYVIELQHTPDKQVSTYPLGWSETGGEGGHLNWAISSFILFKGLPVMLNLVSQLGYLPEACWSYAENGDFSDIGSDG